MILVAGLVFGACGVVEVDESDSADAGIVRFVDVEGGCWVIDSPTDRYEPINLDESFRVDGLFVAFSAVDRADLASICQVGRIVEITEIGIPED